MAPVLFPNETSFSITEDGDTSSPPLPPDRGPRAKHSRRPFHWSRPKTYARHRLASSTDPADAVSIRPHHRTLYVAHVARHRVPREPETAWWNAHHLPRKAGSRFENRLGDEDVELARCKDFRLPGQPRVPSLERQDAFCEGRRGVGLKKQAQVQCERTRGRKRPMEVDDEELYRMGLLYDDEHERGEGFGMDMIERGPVEDGDDKDAEWEEERWKLDLALSFAQLGDDEALAAFLMAPGAEERVVGGAGRVTRRHEGLTVVYELEEDSCWTQRPELEDEWAFLDASTTGDRDDNDKSATATNPDTDAWIVLGSDGL
ncbi:hypothetical protein B0T18DRAFT_395124 [Schizothecium vesticola]|uniref:Uncharacterized protein n=1 Tax=Schizothecium vesticola TaxID=314040 RepID=A0AA40BR57_9PEZI|nr:hypothetical protein B0T18DRAFT_395124 [Schizothecium vesticola]